MEKESWATRREWALQTSWYRVVGLSNLVVSACVWPRRPICIALLFMIFMSVAAGGLGLRVGGEHALRL